MARQWHYSVSNGLPGCYMPDNISGPYSGTTRRELVALIRDQIAYMDWPASVIRQVKIRRLWNHVGGHGASCAHFSLDHGGYQLSFHGLTDDDAAQMESEND
jgi:hypothetical protein